MAVWTMAPRRWLDEFGVFVAMSVSTRISFQSSTWFGCCFRRLRDPAPDRTSERDRCGRGGEDRDPGRGDDESPMEIHCLLLLLADVTEGRLAPGGAVRKLEIPTVCAGALLSRCASSVRERTPSFR